MNARFCPFAVRLVFLPLLWLTARADAAIPLPTIQFGNSTYGFFENQTNVIDIHRFGDTNVACSVQWSFTGGTATPNADFFGGSSTINFAAGQTFASLPIFIVDDSTFEADETANFGLSAPANAVIGFPSNAVLTIYNEDASNPPPASVVQFITDVYGRNENTGDASLTVTRSGDTSNACSVNWSVTGGSASAGADYSPSSGTLNFAAFETFKNISLLIVDDALVESNETVNLTLSGAINATIGFPSNAVLTISDNDVSNAPPAVQFVASLYGRLEHQTAPINVERVGDTSGTSTVQWGVMGGTATPGADFTGETSGTLMFGPGESIAPLPIAIVDDLIVEPDETVNLFLHSPTNATLGSPTFATLTIFDNDTTNTTADLDVIKQPDQFNLGVGGVVSYTITVQNNGPATATNIVVPDTLGAGLAYHSASFSPPITFDVPARTFTLPSLASGANVSMTIRATATTNGFLTNIVSATAAAFGDPNPNNNTNIVTVTVTNAPPQADVLILKTSSATNPVPVGTYINYTLLVSNAGPNIASNIMVWDSPPGTMSGYPPICTLMSGTVQCSLPSLAPGESIPYVIQVRADTDGQMINAASVSSSTADPNSTNNFSTVTNYAFYPADIAIYKSSDVTNVVPNDFVRFTLIVSNGGPALARGIQVVDQLPGEMLFANAVVIPIQAGGAIYDSQSHQVRAQLEDLPPGQFWFVEITARAFFEGRATNTAEVFIAPGDTNLVNNISHAAVNIAFPKADLSVRKVATNATIYAGQEARFYITVSNAGPTTVSNVIVPDSPDMGLQPSFILMDTNADWDFGTNTFRIFSLPSGRAQELEVWARAWRPGLLTNRITVAVPPGIGDTNMSNNNSFAYVNVLPAADLDVFKRPNGILTNAGESVPFTIRLLNFGPNTASNIVVRDVAPAGTTLVSSNVPAGTTYDPPTGNWSVPALVSNETKTLTLTLSRSTPGAVTNTASVISSALFDTFSLNNTDAVTVTWIPIVNTDLGLTVTAQTNLLLTGQVVQVEFMVTNAGPRDASNVTVYAPLPPGTALVNWNGNLKWIYDAASGNWTRTDPLIVSGRTFFTFDVRATNTGVKNFTGQISASQPPDPFVANNSATSSVVVLAPVNLLGLVKCASNGPVFPGVTITVTTTNAPPRTTVTDTNGAYAFTNLTPALYIVTPSSNGFTFLPTNQTVNATGGTSNLPPFIAIARFITGQVLSGTNGSPVPGITVQLTGDAAATMLTDQNGVFIFTNLNPGSYAVRPLTNGHPYARFTPTNANFALGNPTNWTNSVTFYLTNKVVVLRALEVVQVSQDWSNTVPLVAGKGTLVRAHLQLLGTNTEPVDVTGARLFATNLLGGGSENWLAENRTINVWTNHAAARHLRSNINSTLNFPLPDDWRTGRLELKFEWTNGVVVFREPAEPGGIASNGAVRLSFTNMPELGVRFIKVAWTNGAVTNVPSAADVDEQRLRVLSIFPVAKFTELDGYFFWKRTIGAPTNEGRLLRALDAARLVSTDTNGAATNRIWYGLVANKVLRGLGYLRGGTAHGNVSTSPNSFQRHLAGHELGHTLRRPHAVHSTKGQWFNPETGMLEPNTVAGICGERGDTPVTNYPMVNIPFSGLRPTLGPLSEEDHVIWGYDHYLRRVISPYYTYDLMSYCHGGPGTEPWPWPSKYTYTNIQNQIINLYGAGGAPPPAFAQRPKSSSFSMLVRGDIQLVSGALEMLPCFPISTGTLPAPEPGEYLLRVVDDVGQTLLDIPFTPDVPMVEQDYVPSVAHFNIEVPILPGAAGLIVYKGGIPIGTLAGTANPPVVQMLQPNGGEVFGNSGIHANWFGADPDGDPLQYLLQFSADGGAHWTTLTIDWDGTSLDIPADALAATSQGKLRVIASDGFRFSGDESDGLFVILNHDPAVAIAAPSSGELFFGEQTIVFEANANDLDEGALTGANLVWRSDRDGLLGTGTMLLREVTTLSEGAHLITVTATDSGGLTNAAMVNIRIAYEEPPLLAIEHMLPDVLLSWPVTATNYHLQRALSLPGVWSNVTNAMQTVDDKAQVTLPASDPAKYFRLIKP